MTTSGPAGAFEALAPESGEACAVKLSIFEGPLDLLLHLIRLNEVDITDIPIASIAQQYAEYVALMRELNLDVAGEYLLMAATLAWIKSRMLLPSMEPEAEEGGDPRAELLARLLEYQRFKEVAGELGERPLLEREVFVARGSEPEPTPEGEREIEVGLLPLLEAYRRVLQQARVAAATHEVTTETVTVRDRMEAVIAALKQVEALDFDALFVNADGSLPSRAVLVTTFLAILELARLRAIRLFQSLGEDGAPQGPIHLRRGTEEAATWDERVSDYM
jgi:segregation and condensation protein A